MDEAVKKKPFYKTWWFWILVILVVVAVSNQGKKDDAITSDAPASNVDQPTTKEVMTIKQTAVPTPAISASVQKSVLDFEKSVYALEATKQPIFDQYQTLMTALGKGETDVNTVYQATTYAQQAAEDLQLNFSSLPLPSGLPKDISKILTGSRDDMSTAYYEKNKAFAAVLKYLDDQKPSIMQTVKDDMGMGDQFIMSAVAKILDAKNKVGIDITAK